MPGSSNSPGSPDIWRLDLRDFDTVTSVRLNYAGGQAYNASYNSAYAELQDSSKSTISGSRVELSKYDYGWSTLPVSGSPKYIKFDADGETDFRLWLSMIEVNGTVLTNGAHAYEIDVLNDTPTNYEDGGTVHGNFATWNPLAAVSNSAGNLSTYAQGNLQCTTNNSATSGALGTLGVSSGKWYWEITYDSKTGGTGLEIGAAQNDLQSTISSSEGPGTSSNGYFYIDDGRKVNNNSASSYGASYTFGDVIGVALDLDNSQITFYKNNTTQGVAYSSMNSGIYFPACGDYNDSGTSTCTANFGQRSFKYTPPTGFKALCTQNLEDTFSGDEVNDPSYYFAAQAYTGTGASNVKNFNFKPGVVWGKQRNTANNHALASIELNGYETSKYLRVDTTDAWQDGGGAPVTTWGATSATLGSQDRINGSGGSYVLYAWGVGASANASDISDDSTGNKTVLAGDQWVSTAGGFSLTFIDTDGDDANFSHGLNAAPEFIFAKKLNSTSHWHVYHDSIHSGGGYLNLESDGTGSSSSTGAWKQAPDASKIYVHDNFVNGDWLYFAWTPIAGYSQFGTYEGNASSDGLFIYCGFRPKYVVTRNVDRTANWTILDLTRDDFRNPVGEEIYADHDTGAGDAGSDSTIDFLSNGFKITDDGTRHNRAETHIFWAFAEHPQKTSRAR